MKLILTQKTRRTILSAVLAAVLVFVYTAGTFAYGAETDYTLQHNRYNQNRIMDEQIQKLIPELYLDTSLGEMTETRQTPMTQEEQDNIKALGEEILAAHTPFVSLLTDYEKVHIFHDWIKDHFYYYNAPDTKQNPAQLYEMYIKDPYGRVLTWCNGYSAMLIAFARSQGIPATTVSGHYIRCSKSYDVPAADKSWAEESLKRPLTQKTHWWTICYVKKNGKNQWIQIDCNADCYNSFSTGDYTTSSQSLIDRYSQVLFDPDLYTFSRSHILWGYRLGSHSMKCFIDEDEVKQIRTFLQQRSAGMTNGYRSNGALYDPLHPETWFSSGSKSESFGNGKLYRLYLPEKKRISGSLMLTDFEKLRNIKVSENSIDRIEVLNCPGIVTVNAKGNKIKTAKITGSVKTELVNLLNNPLERAEYMFKNGKKAVVEKDGEGTFELRYYLNSKGEPRHYLHGIPDTGYVFDGWYNGEKNVNTSDEIISTKSADFSYRAVFRHKMSYFENEEEKQQLLQFLEYVHEGAANGVKTRGNDYNPSDTTKWFKDKSETKALRSGRLYKLYLPEHMNISGELRLEGFKSLRNIKISRNPVTSAYISGADNLRTFAAVDCNLETAYIQASDKATLINLLGNSMYNVTYTFKGGSTASLYTPGGGTIQVKYYLNSKGEPRHKLVADADEGYTFKGWYSNEKRINKKSTIISTKNRDFEYAAVFENSVE